MRKEKVAILGGSRGLGAALSEILQAQGHEIFMVSRKPSSTLRDAGWFSADFSQKNLWPSLIQKINENQPEVLIYCAGGGPYGKFGGKAWRDQEWALTVTFEFPSFLAWEYCAGENLTSVQKFIVIGSAVAESTADPQAAMYCASKHALKGLIDCLKIEYPDKSMDLFSAPYMDTDLLPSGAWPRRTPGLVRSPHDVAQNLVNSLLDRPPR